jgi:hypothetical protein
MATKSVEFKEGIPVDKDGVPLVEIGFAAQELLPTGKFANITVGPASARKFVPDGSQEDLAKAIAELAKPVEWALGHRRDQILKEISGESTGDDE